MYALPNLDDPADPAAPGRPQALGFNLVRRCLERGDTVLATVRRPSPALEELAQN